MKLYVDEIIKAVDGNKLYWKDHQYVTSIRYVDERPELGCLYFLDDDYDEEEILYRMNRNQVKGVIIDKNYKINLNKWIQNEIGVIEVNNLRNAYLGLAKYHRALFDIPMIEVIGSSGKTTTKEMIGCILNEHYHTLVGHENYNAPSGVAYNLLRLKNGHQAGVLEVGMKGFGIMDLSSSMIKPNIGVVTSIHGAHLTNLGSSENIIIAKSEILNHLSHRDILMINGDDVNCLNMPLHKFKGKLYTFGLSEVNDIYAEHIEYKDGYTTFDAVYVENQKIERNHFRIHTFGKYNVTNSLAAILVGYLLGIPVSKIQRGLNQFEPVKGRQEILKGINHSIIINDKYNANPDSTKMLIEELPNITKGKPLVLVLGDVERQRNEIAEYAKKVHYEIGKKLASLNLTYLVLIGKWVKETRSAAIDYGVDENIIYYYPDVEDAKKQIKKLISEDSYVVFKSQDAYVDLMDLIKEVIIK